MSVDEGRCRQCDCDPCLDAFPVTDEQVALDEFNFQLAAMEGIWRKRFGTDPVYEEMLDPERVLFLGHMVSMDAAGYARDCQTVFNWLSMLRGDM